MSGAVRREESAAAHGARWMVVATVEGRLARAYPAQLVDVLTEIRAIDERFALNVGQAGSRTAVRAAAAPAGGRWGQRVVTQ